jgi:hypothetical protein
MLSFRRRWPHLVRGCLQPWMVVCAVSPPSRVLPNLPTPRGRAGSARSVSFAPLVLNLIAVVVQAIPATFLLSSRSTPWGPLWFRAVLAAIYLFLPNQREFVGIVTNSQWILAIVAILVLVALPPRSTMGRAFDLMVYVLCCLTGPFCIFLFPIAILLLWGRRRESWSWVTLGVLLLGGVIQGLSLLLLNTARPHSVLGANPEWFVRLLAGDIYLGTLLGGNIFSLRLSAETLGCIAVVGTLVLILCVLDAPVVMKCLLLFSCLLFAAALANPTTASAPGTTAWKTLAGSEGA